MYFYPYRFSLPNVTNHLSNYANMLYNRNEMVSLNSNTAPFMSKAQDNAVDNITTNEEKTKINKISEKLENDVTKFHNNKDNKVKITTNGKEYQLRNVYKRVIKNVTN